MNTNQWVIDPTHSEILFKVKHMMISTVTGHFKDFNATVETDGEDFSTARISFKAAINSISTNNEQRDGHLKNGDFFEAEKYPELQFTGNKMEKITNESYKLHGMLTMRGVSKEVSLDVEFGGTTIDPWGNTRAGFEINGKINRKDFGVSFSMVSETGSILLGEEVKIHANAEFVRQVAAKAA